MGLSLFLAGGGAPHEEAALWRELLAVPRRIVFWPFASERSQYAAAHRAVTAALTSLAPCEVVLWSDLAERSPAELETSDVVFVGGGNTYALLDHVRRSGWLEPLRTHVLAGGLYAGDSAGAVLAGADIDIARFADPNDVGLTDTAALDVLGGALVRPHYRPADLEEARSWAARTGRTVLGIPENAGLVVSDDVVRNVGPAAVDVVTATTSTTLRPGETHPL